MKKKGKIMLVSISLAACLLTLAGCSKVDLTGSNTGNNPGGQEQGGTPPEGMTPPDDGSAPEGMTPPDGGSAPEGGAPSAPAN